MFSTVYLLSKPSIQADAGCIWKCTKFHKSLGGTLTQDLGSKDTSFRVSCPCSCFLAQDAATKPEACNKCSLSGHVRWSKSRLPRLKKKLL